MNQKEPISLVGEAATPYVKPESFSQWPGFKSVLGPWWRAALWCPSRCVCLGAQLVQRHFSSRCALGSLQRLGDHQSSFESQSNSLASLFHPSPQPTGRPAARKVWRSSGARPRQVETFWLSSDFSEFTAARGVRLWSRSSDSLSWRYREVKCYISTSAFKGSSWPQTVSFSIRMFSHIKKSVQFVLCQLTRHRLLVLETWWSAWWKCSTNLSWNQLSPALNFCEPSSPRSAVAMWRIDHQGCSVIYY